MRVRLRTLSVLPVLLLAALLFYLVGLPLVLLLVSSFRPTGFPLEAGWSFAHYVRVYTDPTFYALILNTANFAVGSIGVAILVGATLAWLVERTDMPMRPLVRAMVILPMGVPPVLLAIGWAMLLSPRIGFVNQVAATLFGLERPLFNVYSLGGMIFVEGLALVPSTFLLLAPAFRNIDSSLEEAALTSGASTWRLMRKIVLPLLRPALLAAIMYLAIVSLVVFDIPGALGMPAGYHVLSTRIYHMVSNSPTGIPDYGGISAMAVLFVVILVALALGYQQATAQGSRFVTITGKNYRARPYPLGWLRWLAFGYVSLYFLLAVLAPLGILIWTSLTPYLMPVSTSALGLLSLSNHIDFFSNALAAEAAANSLLIAVISASLVALLSLLVSWVVVRSRVPGRGIIDVMAFIPLAIPGVMIGVALIYTYLAIAIIPIYGTIWIITVAYVTTFVSFGSRATNGVMLQMHQDLEDAAKTSGASPLFALRRIVIPLIAPALVAVWIWVFAHAMRELTSALMLQGFDNSTLPTILWDYWSTGQPNKAAAVGAWLMVSLLLVVTIWQIVSERIQVRGTR